MVVFANDKTLEEKLKTEGIKHWKMMEKFFEKAHFVWIDQNGQYKGITETVRYELDSESKQFLLKREKIETLNPDNIFYETITVLNKKYSFEISKKKQETEWRVLSCEKSDKIFLQKENDALLIPMASFAIMGVPLTQLLQFPNFVITNIYQEKVDAHNAIVFDFNLESNNTFVGSINDVKKGTIYVLPENFWAISKVHLIFERQTPKKLVTFQNMINISYSNAKSIPPSIDSVEYILLRGEKVSPIKWISKFEEFTSSHKFDKLHFTLSHYGLPEPDFGERRTNRVRYIIMGLGLLMMIIGAWRMIRERRKRF
jgi:hypothetical protein